MSARRQNENATLTRIPRRAVDSIPKTTKENVLSSRAGPASTMRKLKENSTANAPVSRTLETQKDPKAAHKSSAGPAQRAPLASVSRATQLGKQEGTAPAPSTRLKPSLGSVQVAHTPSLRSKPPTRTLQPKSHARLISTSGIKPSTPKHALIKRKMTVYTPAPAGASKTGQLPRGPPVADEIEYMPPSVKARYDPPEQYLAAAENDLLGCGIQPELSLDISTERAIRPQTGNDDPFDFAIPSDDIPLDLPPPDDFVLDF
ncbi:hypothetical protein IAU60_005700 [Kwoniella sp. DSM 27419]